LGCQNWQDASSTKKDYNYFDMFDWAKNHCHSKTAGIKTALNKGFDLFSGIRFSH